jgi:putative membrane protein
MTVKHPQPIGEDHEEFVVSAAVAAFALSAIAGISPAQAAASSQDSAFLMDIEQTNLAE